jgi:DNA-directed RNA polymerase subunit RPC12/RpoP
MDLQEEVKAHTRRVEAGERVRYGQACPHCGVAKDVFFRMHDCRRRTFRLVLGRCIQVALSWIVRWRCLRCGKRFTDYPPFRLTAQAVRQAAGA